MLAAEMLTVVRGTPAVATLAVVALAAAMLTSPRGTPAVVPALANAAVVALELAGLFPGAQETTGLLPGCWSSVDDVQPIVLGFAAALREAEPDDHGEETEGHDRHLISSGNDTEENVTIISESMTVTSADEEKLLLLNRNTDLRRLNKETRIYEADYKTEHKDRERMKNENSKLRRKEEELRQQMALQQEQLKVYEDDFRKERSDKQVLQRLLLKKAGPTDPVLVHRCNNEPECPPGERQGSAHRSSCAKHCERHRHKASECRRAQRPHQHQDAEVQASPFTIDYH
ncbi:UNVERIFIED_CONTAM: hypothetical protein FKN15_026362 [Acipenser sinensis]